MLSDAMVGYEIRYGVRSMYLRPPYGSYDARVKSVAEPRIPYLQLEHRHP